jgi:hypothetical protein
MWRRRKLDAGKAEICGVAVMARKNPPIVDQAADTIDDAWKSMV